MKSASFDPSRRIDIYLRVNRLNSRTFTFTFSDGSPVSMTYEDLHLIIKSNSGDIVDIITLTFGDGLTVSDNQIQAVVTADQSLISEGEYYWELYNVDTDQTWINGKAFLHNGEFDGVGSDIEGIVIGSETPIEIVLFQPFMGGSGSVDTDFIVFWNFAANAGAYPTNPKKLYIAADNSNPIVPQYTWFVANKTTPSGSADFVYK